MTRTSNLLIRSQMLYPLSYERLCREMSVVGPPEMARREISSSAMIRFQLEPEQLAGLAVAKIA
jgi:hypothetical protein